MSNDQLDMAKIKPENVVDDGHASDLTSSIQRFVQIIIRSCAYANYVSFFHSSVFSDLKIATKDQEFKGHKLWTIRVFAQLFKQN